VKYIYSQTNMTSYTTYMTWFAKNVVFFQHNILFFPFLHAAGKVEVVGPTSSLR
jgi:hypothetical protein